MQEDKEGRNKDSMAKDQETEQHKQVSVKVPCYFSHDGPCGGRPKPITSREFQLESWPGPAGTSPKSITSCPFYRGQQDLALASQSAPTFSSGVALILQEQRGNKQEDNNSLSVHSFTQRCVFICMCVCTCLSLLLCLSLRSRRASAIRCLGRSTRATSLVAAI